jgi:hypothetical protein
MKTGVGWQVAGVGKRSMSNWPDIDFPTIRVEINGINSASKSFD